MTKRDYTCWADDCPARIMIVVYQGRAKLLSHCSDVLDELEYDAYLNFEDVEECTLACGDGVFVFDVAVENEQWMTDYGMEYDVALELHSPEPATAEMWAAYCRDEHVWPDDFYAPAEFWTDDGFTGLMQVCGTRTRYPQTCQLYNGNAPQTIWYREASGFRNFQWSWATRPCRSSESRYCSGLAASGDAGCSETPG